MTEGKAEVAMASKIEWTESSWNPVIGCTKVSAGCKNCYAEEVTRRMQACGVKKYIERDAVRCGKWTGNVYCVESELDKPLHWRKPRLIFVCSMSDLFHEKVPFEFIDKVMAVIACCGQHSFQVLTKRADRALEYFERLYSKYELLESAALTFGRTLTFESLPLVAAPIKNLWLGVTCENQKTADERIPILLQIQAAVRFVSIEPCLEDVDLDFVEDMSADMKCVACGAFGHADSPIYMCPSCGCGEYEEAESYQGGIDWVIVGCESGANRRPCKLKWVRSIVSQCQSAGVPVFVKQLDINGKVEHDISKFPPDLQVRQYPERQSEK